MFPSDIYEDEVGEFLIKLMKIRDEDDNELIQQLSIPEMLRHIQYAKRHYGKKEGVFDELMGMLRKIWSKDAKNIHGNDVKNKLDNMGIGDSKLNSFLDNGIDNYDLWFQLIWITYRLRGQLWDTVDDNAPAFAKRTGKEGNKWVIEDIIKVLETWPLVTNNSDTKFPSNLHHCAIINLQVLRRRRAHVFEADELLKKAKSLYYARQEEGDGNRIYGAYKYIDIPAALALAEAINSAYTNQYARTIDLCMGAWSEASKLSIKNPMRVLFMAWSASCLTMVYIRCDLQNRIKESKKLYPRGIFETNKGDYWQDWCDNLRNEDFLPKIMLFDWKDKKKNDWAKTREAATEVYDFINKINIIAEKREEEEGGKTPKVAWFEYIEEASGPIDVEKTDDVFQKALKAMCAAEEKEAGVNSKSINVDSIVEGVDEWLVLTKDEIGADSRLMDKRNKIRSQLAKYVKKRKALNTQPEWKKSKNMKEEGEDFYLKHLRMISSHVSGHGKKSLKELILIWKKKEVQGVNDVPDSLAGRQELVKSCLKLKLSLEIDRREIFKLFDGAGCKSIMDLPGAESSFAGSWNRPALPTEDFNKSNFDLLKGIPKQNQVQTLFNYVSIQLTRLAFSIVDRGEGKGKPAKRSDTLDIARLEFRFLWVVHLMTWSGISEPSKGMLLEDKKRLIYRDLPMSGWSERALKPKPKNWDEQIKKMGALLDDYEDNCVKIFQSHKSTSRPLLLLMARMLNYRWFSENQWHKTGKTPKHSNELDKVKKRFENILNKIMIKLKDLHPIKLYSGWNYSEWFKRSCGPLEDSGATDFKIKLGSGKKESKTSLKWLQEVSFFDVCKIDNTHRGQTQSLLLIHPRSFANPKYY